MKAEVIPKHVIKLAETMKQLKSGNITVIVQSRRHSMNAALRLLETQDAEVIDQKQIENKPIVK